MGEKKGFTLELKIDGTSWTAYYEDVDMLLIKRRIGAGQNIKVVERIEVGEGNGVA